MIKSVYLIHIHSSCPKLYWFWLRPMGLPITLGKNIAESILIDKIVFESILWIIFEIHCFHLDPRVNDWPMMDSPFPTICICLFYAFFNKILMPKFMANRRPYDLRNTLIAYNLFQTVFSAWIFYEVSKIVEFAHHLPKSSKQEKPTVQMLFCFCTVCILHIIGKINNTQTDKAQNKSCLISYFIFSMLFFCINIIFIIATEKNIENHIYWVRLL